MYDFLPILDSDSPCSFFTDMGNYFIYYEEYTIIAWLETIQEIRKH